MRLFTASFITLVFATQLVAQTAPPPATTSMSSPLFQSQALMPDANADTRALTQLQLKFEDATIRGDLAFVTSVEDPTMTMVHGDAWTNGGRPLEADDRAAYNKRVADQLYYIHDLDRSSLRYEMHQDVAICYGRYVSVIRNPAGSKTPGRMTSIWFERVFKKGADGQWKYLSHRTVHGPVLSPAGIDPSRVAWTSTTAEQAKTPVYPQGSSAMPPGAKGVPVDKDPTASKSPVAAEVLAFQKSIEDALVNGDVATIQKTIADDFTMVHGDIWIRGGPAEHVDGKQQFLDYAATKHYAVRDNDHLHVELHSDVAIVYGRYVGLVPAKAKVTPQQAWFSAWYLRIYEKRNGQWRAISHRTVFGPTYGPTREAIGER